MVFAYLASTSGKSAKPASVEFRLCQRLTQENTNTCIRHHDDYVTKMKEVALCPKTFFYVCKPISLSVLWRHYGITMWCKKNMTVAKLLEAHLQEISEWMNILAETL